MLSSLAVVAGPVLEGCVWRAASWLDRGGEGRRGREGGRRRRRGGGRGGTVSLVLSPRSWEGGVGVARGVVEGGGGREECECVFVLH